MERGMCSYLEWQLNIEPVTLRDFVRAAGATRLCRPPIILPSPSPSPFSRSGAAVASVSTSIPSFGHRASPSQPSIIPNPTTITYPLHRHPIPPKPRTLPRRRRRLLRRLRLPQRIKPTTSPGLPRAPPSQVLCLRPKASHPVALRCPCRRRPPKLPPHLLLPPRSPHNHLYLITQIQDDTRPVRL